ncbi:phosphotransferase [Thermomonas sp.]|uniref:aminoglycoside phosphotransferase family protein n=1 Tax=Thermomonas sp. TaxID=1971895 RepID=UPI00261AEA75|nr:phosphotransferase [Thermomonas sp.]MCO5054704.1 phosphotransferase [Thermomonas sp.]
MTSTCPDPHDARAMQRLAWARAALNAPGAELERASTDAGFRSYWRTIGPGPSRIVMDSPPDKEDVRPWLRLRDLLEGGGVRVPQVLASDVEAGFLLLEDLGRDTYLQVIDADNADALFDAALEQLLKIQHIATPAELPAYDAPMLMRELRLFDEWFCERHLGLALSDAERGVLAEAHRFLIESALAQPQVLVHRDFMPRNLMPASAGPAVLDFQDAVRGPLAYDALSLFKDAFLSWPEARVDAWLDHYHARATTSGLPVPSRTQFRRDADLIGVQRHLKVIGIFARLHHRDGKPKYLADVPRFFRYLDATLPRYRELDGLRGFLDARVRPALAAAPQVPSS